MQQNFFTQLTVRMSMVTAVKQEQTAVEGFFPSAVHQLDAFSALKLLVWRQKGHLACKNRVVGCWCGCLPGARCRLAYGPADATATHCLLLQ